MSAVDLLLSRMPNVRQYTRGWRADCPVGHSSSGALSIAEADDGRALMHCFVGCSPAEAIGALGLTLADLYPKRERDASAMGRAAVRVAIRESDWRAALGVLARESLIVLAVACETQRDLLTAEDADRLLLAVERIRRAREVLIS